MLSRILLFITTTLLLTLILSQACPRVGYRDVCCAGLIIGTPSNANNLDGFTCCEGDPTHAIQVGVTSCTARNPVAMTALASVSGGVGVGTTTTSRMGGSSSLSVTSRTTESSVSGSGSATITNKSESESESESSSRGSSISASVSVESTGAISLGAAESASTAGGAMMTQAPLLLAGGAAAIFAYGTM